MRAKSSKLAWNCSADDNLVKLISVIGPRSWDEIATKIPNRTGKQCRERWNNHLDPLVMKNQWSMEENWVLFILQRSAQNRWAKIANVLLGRPDNSIKNYWNCTFRHKQNEMVAKLDSYMSYCLEKSRPKDTAAFKNDITERLLKHFVNESHRIYIEYLEGRRSDLHLEEE